MALQFEVLYQSTLSAARVGRIVTEHGVIETPTFVPVGTNGSLKAIDNAHEVMCEVALMFCNTYHLLLQPGADVVRQAGGLHAFIGRQGPIITDSGGFQIFSLAYGSVANELKSKGSKQQNNSVVKINEEGAWFRSYRDGALVKLTPESSVAVQKDLAADIIIPLDELPPYHMGDEALLRSMARTHRWEMRSLSAHRRDPRKQSMYAVVHGGLRADLRQASSEYLAKQAFDGFAIGGSLGRCHEDLEHVLQHTVRYLPPEKPRHLLGLADQHSVQLAISYGMDSLDSSYPTKAARHGVLYTPQGAVKIRQRLHRHAYVPVDESCGCSTCRHYTRAYLHHLYKAHEPTFMTLASVHNVAFMAALMQRYRSDILAGNL